MYNILFIYLLTVFFSPIIAQDYTHQKRTLRILQEEADTIIIALKTNRKGEIIKLKQEIVEELVKDTAYILVEDYRKGKYWTLNRVRKVYEETVLDGKQYQYHLDGSIHFIINYQLNKPSDTYLSYHYYPNGQLKLVAEIKQGQPWNILTFKDAQGKEHDYGTFKNGTGTLLWLNEQGEPCLECSYNEEQQLIKEVSNCK